MLKSAGTRSELCCPGFRCSRTWLRIRAVKASSCIKRVSKCGNNRAEKYLHLNSRIFVSLLTLIVILLYYKPIIGLFGSFAILAGLINVVGGFGIGYLLGWPDRGSRLSMGYMHGARSASIAVMVANDAFRDQPNVMLMIALVTVLILAILLPLSFVLKIKPAPVSTSS